MHKKGRLGVFECGELAGVVTASDLIRKMPDAPETSLKVDDFVTRGIVSVREDETVASVTGKMGAKRVGSVIVIHDGKPAGIFTERDLLSTFLVWGKSPETPVGMASTSPLKSAPNRYQYS